MRVQSFQYFAEQLPTRTKRELKVIHVAARPDVFKCLDFNMEAATLEELRANIVAYYLGAGEEDALPSAPVEEWRAIWGKEPMRQEPLRELLEANHFIYWAVVRE
jgi:hypothetical protein